METQLEKVQAKGLDMAEWQRLYARHQQEYKRKRLRALGLAMEASSYRGLARAAGCGKSTLTRWLSCYLAHGLAGLVADISRARPERLTQEQKLQLAQWLEHKQPADLGVEEAYIWTAKRIVQVVGQQFGVVYQPTGIYKLLDRMGISYQRGHRDYGNASQEQQQAFVDEFKKKSSP